MRIGLFLNNLDEEYQISMYKSIRDEAASLGMDLICVQGETLYDRNKTEQDSGPLPSHEFIAADGILILSSSIMNRTDTAPPPPLKQYIHCPLVSIGSRYLDYPSIVVRNRKSMNLLMEHLILFHGYRKLLFIGGPVWHPDNMVREHTFRRTVNTFKEQFPGLEGTVINGEFHQTSAVMMIREYIKNHPHEAPDVIVAANDNMALGALEILGSQQDSRWHNCPVTGFDDINQASLGTPALTTIRQPLDELGRLAVRTLRDLMEGREVSQVIHIESELKIRHSCGCTGSRETGILEQHVPEPDKSEYHIQNVGLLGQALAAANSLNETLPPLSFFLTNLEVKTFYLILYPRPMDHISSSGSLVYWKNGEKDTFLTDFPEIVDMKGFFCQLGGTNSANEHCPPPPPMNSWCVYHLCCGREYLGLIVYEASDKVHPQICSAAIFLGNTVKRLELYENEKKQAQRLEQEVALRTKDLTETYQKLREETRRRTEVEAEVLRISEMERLRFSMDLHDDICQRLAGISMFCKSFMSGVAPQSFLPELSELIDETLARTRRYAHDSFPMELDTLGLREALNALCHTVTRQTASRCIFLWEGPEKSPFASTQDLNIYRIVQEALQNAVKHAGSNRINVQVRFSAEFFIVSVRDNGTGNSRLNEEAPVMPDIKHGVKRAGLGLRSMRYRAHQLGAEYLFQSAEQGGTTVEIRIPLVP